MRSVVSTPNAAGRGGNAGILDFPNSAPSFIANRNENPTYPYGKADAGIRLAEGGIAYDGEWAVICADSRDVATKAAKSLKRRRETGRFA